MPPSSQEVAVSKESWLIAIGIGFIHAKIASHENLRRVDDLHNQSGDAFPGHFCPLKGFIPLSRLVIHLILVCQPCWPQDGVVQPGGFDEVGGRAKRRQICTDLATVPCAEFTWNFVIDPK